MEILIWAVILGLIPAIIAQNKGHSFWGWWLYGALIFIVALPHSLIIKKNLRVIEERAVYQGMRKCPFCAEMIKNEAVVCRYCSREVGVYVSSTEGSDLKGDDRGRLLKICRKCGRKNAVHDMKCISCGQLLQ